MTSPERERPGNVTSFAGGLGVDVAWTYVSVLVTAASTLFLVGFALRQLGTEAYGIYILIASATGLVLIVDFALGILVTQSTAESRTAVDPDTRRDRREEVQAAHSVYVMIGALAGTISAATCVILWLTGSPLDVVSTGLLTAWGFSVTLALAAVQGIATGAKRFDVVALSTAVASSVTVGTAVLLVPSLGLVALGVAQLASALALRAVQALWIRRVHPELWPSWRRPTRASLRKIAASAGPIALASGGAYMVNTANLALIGILLNPSAVGLFRAASSLPTQAVQVLYRGYDVAFPSLVTAADQRSREEFNALLTRIASFVAGLGFGALIGVGDDAVTLLIGDRSTIGTLVLSVVAISWLVNVPAHGIVLLLVATGKQRLLVPLTVTEGVMSIALTALLTARYGVAGAAYSGLITITISNAVVLPVLVRRSMGPTAVRTIYLDGYGRASAGLATGLVLSSAGALWQHGSGVPWPSLLLCLAGGVPIGMLTIGSRGRRMLAAAARRRAVAHPIAPSA